MNTIHDLVLLNPFPGLRPFATVEADRFFGRRQQIEELVKRIGEVNFVAVAGNSGCGKSSLVRAGLLNELVRLAKTNGDTEWRFAVMTPGNQPIANLAEQLSPVISRNSGSGDFHVGSLYGRLRLGGLGLVEAVRFARLDPKVRVLIVVDQFEEIFRYHMTDVDEASAFVKLLINAAHDPESPISVVITLRSETLGYCADFRNLPEIVNRGQYLVPRLTREQRKEAIVKPVELRGYQIAPRLVQRLLNDISEDFDDLPVMQHVLARTWCRWAQEWQGSRPIDLEDYIAVGTAEQALSKHADQAYASLSGLGSVAEKVFRVLTERAPDGTENRRPLNFDRLCEVVGCDRDQVEQVVQRFRRPDTAFLMPPQNVAIASNPVIDISHESLIRQWDRLKKWVSDEASSAEIYRDLLNRVDGWPKEKVSELGKRDLARFENWRDQCALGVNWSLLYVDKPEVYKRSLEFLKDRRHKYNRKRAFRLVIALIIPVLICFEIGKEINSYKKEILRNESIKSAFKARRYVEKEPEVALQLARNALKKAPKLLQAEVVLRQAISYFVPFKSFPHYSVVSSAAFSPDGSMIVTASQDGAVRLWDVTNVKKPLRVLPKGEGENAIFSPDGRKIVTTRQDGAVRLSNVTYEKKPQRVLPKGKGENVAFSPDGSKVVITSLDGSVRLWDVTNVKKSSREFQKRGKEEVSQVNNAVFSLDGNKVIIIKQDGTAWLWDAKRGKELLYEFELPGTCAPVSAVFSRDGTKVVVTSLDGAVRLWDVTNGKPPMMVLQEGGAPVNSVVFKSNGSKVVTASQNGSVRLWDAERGDKLRELPGHSAPVKSAAFSPDGAKVVTASNDGSVRLWDAESGEKLREFSKLQESPFPVRIAVFSPDGSKVIVKRQDGSGGIWDTKSRDLRVKIPESTEPCNLINNIVFSPDTNKVVTPGRDGSAQLWDVKDVENRKKRPLELRHSGGPVFSAAFSPDGSKVVTASQDGTARLWDAESGEKLLELSGHGAPVNGVAFSPDGAKVVTASQDGTARVWNVDLIEVRFGHDAPVRSAFFSPDGSKVVTASLDGSVLLWDVTNPKTPLRVLQKGGENVPQVNSAAFSPNGSKVVTASQDGTAQLWDAEGSQKPLEFSALSGPHDSVNSAAFSPDGSKVVTASQYGSVLLWDVTNPKTPLRVLQESGENVPQVNSAAFSPDGSKVIAASQDGSVQLWNTENTENGGKLPTFRKHTNPVNDATFSPDGAKVVTASKDGTARLYDVTDREKAPLELRETGVPVNRAAFSPDGAKVVTANEDGTVTLWDVNSEEIIRKLKWNNFRVNCVSFSSDGLKLVTASEDQTVRIYECRECATVAELMKKPNLPNSLTQETFQDF